MKQFYGESNEIEEGVYPAVISQVIDCGHVQDTRVGHEGETPRKLFFAFFVPSIKKTIALNNFGISPWLSQSKPPFVGLYELITAAEKKEMTAKELREYSIPDLAGKAVTIEIAYQNNYICVAAVSPCDEDVEHYKDIVSISVDDFTNTDLVNRAHKSAQKLFMSSKEWNAAMVAPMPREETVAPVAVPVDADGHEWKVEDVPF